MTAHESRTLRPRRRVRARGLSAAAALFGFLIGLVVAGVVIYFIISGMYSFLDKYEQSQA